MKTLPSKLSKLPEWQERVEMLLNLEFLIRNVIFFIMFISNYELTYYDCSYTLKLYTGNLQSQKILL